MAQAVTTAFPQGLPTLRAHLERFQPVLRVPTRCRKSRIHVVLSAVLRGAAQGQLRIRDVGSILVPIDPDAAVRTYGHDCAATERRVQAYRDPSIAGRLDSRCPARLSRPRPRLHPRCRWRAYTDNVSSNATPSTALAELVEPTASTALDDAPQSAAAFRSTMAGYTWGRVPALAIAAFVRENGAVYSSEILDRFFLSESTLRRRRPELARLGIRFLENGRGSIYATAEVARQLPDTYLPK
jgi:hypothetical protein